MPAASQRRHGGQRHQQRELEGHHAVRIDEGHELRVERAADRGEERRHRGGAHLGVEHHHAEAFRGLRIVLHRAPPESPFGILQPPGDEPGDALIPVNYSTLSIVAVAIGLHVVLLDIAGYVIAATVCFWGVAFGFGSRKYLKDFLISLIFSIVIYFSFSKGLHIKLPTGFMDGLIHNGK